MSDYRRFKIPVFNFLYFAFSVICLIYPAINNGYPLVYSDSGTYIASGFDNCVPVDRPIMYAFFVRHISMAHSLWFVIIMQAIIITTLLVICFKQFLTTSHYFLYAFISILLLSFSTGISSYTSQIMPDIFSAIAIISLCILFSFTDVSKTIKFLMAFFIVFSNMVHSSNLITTTIIVFTMLLVIWLYRKKIQIKIKQLYFILSIIIISWIIIPSMNYLLHAGFKVARAPNIFIMSKLVESGILNQYLHDKCGTSNNKLCNYVDHLPTLSWHFLWHRDSPLYDGGCMENAHISDCWLIKNEEYRPIVNEIVTTPKYFKQYAVFSIKQSCKQLLTFEIENLDPMMENSPVIVNIEWRYKREYQQYISSQQSQHSITSKTINTIQYVLIIFSLIFLSIVFFIKKIRDRIPVPVKKSMIIVFLGILYNAITCATLSTVTGRFQGRIVWIIPLVALIVIFSLYERRKNILLSQRY